MCPSRHTEFQPCVVIEKERSSLLLEFRNCSCWKNILEGVTKESTKGPVVLGNACLLLCLFVCFCSYVFVCSFVCLNSQLSIPRNSFNFGKIPFLVAKRTHGSSLEPTLDAIQMKDVTTISKGNTQTIVVRWRWIGLIFNRRFVQGITANGAL